MAEPDSFKQQAEYLVNLLLGEEEEGDDPESCFRSLKCTEEPEEKQAISKLGHCLRELGDLINKEHLDPFTRDFQKLAEQEAVDQACEFFSNTVNKIFQEWTNGKELAVEQNLLKITASLGRQVANKMPSLVEDIKIVMNSFINSKLRSWLTGDGGWENIHIE
ncbi:bcl-2-like protein 15 [Heptranchias perlo]|uniref:bcl-2-like protein 15 n=1 Tax=Heptranchias perlo TaxID=212740 RepID=UPI003559ECD2